MQSFTRKLIDHHRRQNSNTPNFNQNNPLFFPSNFWGLSYEPKRSLSHKDYSYHLDFLQYLLDLSS